MIGLRSHDYETTPADERHFLGRCLECDANMLRRMSLREVERWYHLGCITQDEWEAYTRFWAESPYRLGDYPEYRTPHATDGARDFYERLCELVGRPPVGDQLTIPTT